MKKIFLILLILTFSFSINNSYVLAEETSSETTITSKDCGVFGDPSDENDFAFYLQWAFKIIKFLGPILLILMTIKDLVVVSAELKQDASEMKKLGSKTLKRFIYAVLIFVLPSLINTVFTLIGLYGTCGIS